LGVVGGVVGTADTVIDVLAEVGSIGVGWVAGFEAECVGTHEVVPFHDLGEGVQVGVAAESVGIDKPTHRVSSEIGAMWVHLATKVARVKVDLGLVDESDDLDVGGGFYELNALESASGDETGASAGFGAPSDHFAFLVCDELVRVGRCP